MKKYFSIIAMVLVAALLVVSCTNEKADFNELVDVTVMADGMNGKALTVVDQRPDTYKYSLVANYTLGERDPYGEIGKTAMVEIGSENDPNKASNTNFKVDGKLFLGYVSQGLWTLTINGYVGTATTPVCTAVKQIYVTSSSKTFTATLAPEANTFGYIEINKPESVTDEKVPAGIGIQSLDAEGSMTLSVTLTPAVGDEIEVKTSKTPVKTEKVGGDTTKSEDDVVESIVFSVDKTAKATDESALYVEGKGYKVPAGSYTMKIEAKQGTTPVSTQYSTIVVTKDNTSYVYGTMSPWQFIDLDNPTVAGIQITGTFVDDVADHLLDSKANTVEAGTALKFTWTTSTGTPKNWKFYDNEVEVAVVTENPAKGQALATVTKDADNVIRTVVITYTPVATTYYTAEDETANAENKAGTVKAVGDEGYHYYSIVLNDGTNVGGKAREAAVIVAGTAK